MTIGQPRLPGFRHNPHSFFHRAMTAMPWYRDLELERHGVRYLEPKLNVAMILRDGRALEWWTDLDRTRRVLRRVLNARRGWAAGLAEEFKPIVERFFCRKRNHRRWSRRCAADCWNVPRLAGGCWNLRVVTAWNFVTRHFENDAVRARPALLQWPARSGPPLEGLRPFDPALLASRTMAQMAVGGTGSLAHGLVADITQHGGEVRCGIETPPHPRAGRRASGVELTTGEQIHASGFVASGLNPQQTFLDLMPVEAVPASVREQAAQFQYTCSRRCSVCTSRLMTAALRCGCLHPELNEAFMS